MDPAGQQCSREVEPFEKSRKSAHGKFFQAGGLLGLRIAQFPSEDGTKGPAGPGTAALRARDSTDRAGDSGGRTQSWLNQARKAGFAEKGGEV